MKNLVIIQARCGSTRLPAKVLLDLAGKTVLERVIQRVQMSKNINEIVVATTINIEDLRLVNLVSGLGIRVFTGSSEDVLDRFYQVGKLLKPEYVIRVTADCPLFDGKVLDEALELIRPNTDYLSMLSETFPDGLDIEILKFSVLEKIWKEAKLQSEREHVTLYLRNHPDSFVFQDFSCSIGNLHDQRWTIDEQADYQFVKTIYDHFAPRWDFSMEDIYNYVRINPEILSLNSNILRNEGLRKSLENDKKS